MKRPRQRIPVSHWKKGQVLRLREPACGIREGCFGFLGQDGCNFKVCRLGEDDAGDLCETDEVLDIHVDFAECFAPAMSIGRI